MALSHRQISEIVQILAEHYDSLRHSWYSDLATKLETVVAGMERLRNVQRRLQICTRRKWLAAATEVTKSLSNNLRWVARDIEQIGDLADRQDTRTPRLAEWVAEFTRQRRNSANSATIASRSTWPSPRKRLNWRGYTWASLRSGCGFPTAAPDLGSGTRTRSWPSTRIRPRPTKRSRIPMSATSSFAPATRERPFALP